MRQVKYRGKGIISEQWVYGYLYQDESGTYIKIPEKNQRFGCGISVIPESVGEFTGLKDKNGKEIFEGDRVKEIAEYGDEHGSYEREIQHEVTFNAGAFYPICMQPSTTFEIIGTIHDQEINT